MAGLLRTAAAHPPPHAAASALVVDDNDAHLLAASTTPLRAPPELLLLLLLLPLQPHAPPLAAPDHNAGAAPAPAPATTLHLARHLLLRPATPKLEGGTTTTTTAAATASSGLRRGKPAARGDRVGPVVLGLLHRCLQELLAALFSRSAGSLSRQPLQLHLLLLLARQRRAALLLLRSQPVRPNRDEASACWLRGDRRSADVCTRAGGQSPPSVRALLRAQARTFFAARSCFAACWALSTLGSLFAILAPLTFLPPTLTPFAPCAPFAPPFLSFFSALITSAADPGAPQ